MNIYIWNTYIVLSLDNSIFKTLDVKISQTIPTLLNKKRFHCMNFEIKPTSFKSLSTSD